MKKDLKRRLFEWLLDFALEHHPASQDSNYLSYGESEMKRAGLYDGDADYGGLIPTAVTRMLRIYAIEGHSGGSHGMVQSIFTRISSFRPLTPLTGDDDEWMEVGPNQFQNRRCSTIFKDGKDGKAYNIDGKVFVEPDGCAYTNIKSRVAVKFPWNWSAPKYVKVKATA